MDADSTPKIEWKIARQEDLTKADMKSLNRVPYFIFGSFNNFQAPVKMAYTQGQDYYQAIIELGPSSEVEFTIKQGMYMRSIFPSVANASPFEEHEVGTESEWTENFWKIGGDADDAVPHKRYEVKVFAENESVSKVTWTPLGDSMAGLEDAQGKGILIF